MAHAGWGPVQRTKNLSTQAQALEALLPVRRPNIKTNLLVLGDNRARSPFVCVDNVIAQV